MLAQQHQLVSHCATATLTISSRSIVEAALLFYRSRSAILFFCSVAADTRQGQIPCLCVQTWWIKWILITWDQSPKEKHSILGANSAYLCAHFVWRCWKSVKWVNKREQLFSAHWWVVSTQIAWSCEGMTCSLFISKHEALLYSAGLWWYLNVNFHFQFTCEMSLVCFFCSSSAMHFLHRNKPTFSL